MLGYWNSFVLVSRFVICCWHYIFLSRKSNFYSQSVGCFGGVYLVFITCTCFLNMCIHVLLFSHLSHSNLFEVFVTTYITVFSQLCLPTYCSRPCVVSIETYWEVFSICGGS